jgi:hypothetical protein
MPMLLTSAELSRRTNFYIGFFVITSATLMLELIQTRILSVIAWYHLAFFVISMAMFGLTAGAVWVYRSGERFNEKTLSYDLSYFSMAFGVTVVLCFAVQMILVPIVGKTVTLIWTWVVLAVCISIPFFFSGVIASIALTRSPFPIGHVYGVDLLGAAVGCLGTLLFLTYTDGPSAVLWVGAIAAGGALFFCRSNIGNTPDRIPPLDSFLGYRKTICFVLALCAVVNGFTDRGLQPLIVKGEFEFPGSFIFKEWNSFSRVVVYPEKKERPQIFGTKMPLDGWIINQRNLNIDGGAATTAYSFTGNLKDVDFLRYDVTNLAYFLPDRKRAGIIGVGAGRDVLSAALFGLKDITGVEINPIIVRLVTREPGFVDFTNLTTLPGTKFVLDEGRSWFARTEEFFDIIQMTLVDTWAATGAGAFTLSENGLYTVEAWKIFLGRLTPKGVFTVSRWYNPEDPNETGRLVSLAAATLMEMGINEPRRHIFLATQKALATLVLSRSPFSSSDLDALQNAAVNYGHQVLVSPNTEPSSKILYNIVSATDLKGLNRYTANLEFDLTPPTDDRPFFFNQLPLYHPIQALVFAIHDAGSAVHGGIREGNLVATATLIMLFLISLILVLAIIVIPLRSAVRDAGVKLVSGGTLYFVLIGIGFMMVEIALLQRMSVYLGHPIYSLSVLLFTLILATGIGSLVSQRLQLDSRTKFIFWAALTGSYIATLPFWLPQVFVTFNSAKLFTRALFCVATVAPAGLLMGFGFPNGIRLISLVDRNPTPWFWGINGAAGVLASIVAVATSIALGITATLIAGAICYLLLIPISLIFIAKFR